MEKETTLAIVKILDWLETLATIEEVDVNELLFCYEVYRGRI